MFKRTKFFQLVFFHSLLILHIIHDGFDDSFHIVFGDIVLLVVLAFTEAQKLKEIEHQGPILDQLRFHIIQTLVRVDLG